VVNTLLSVTALSKATGVGVRNIRAWQTAGLLPPPSLNGRRALYSALHAQRVELIKELRSLGFGLDAIGAMLADVPMTANTTQSLVTQMFSQGFFQVEKPEYRTLEQLASHWGERATPEQVAQLIRNGLYRQVSPPGTPLNEAVFEVLSPSLWSIGKQLADLRMPMSTVLGLQERLIEQCRSLAKMYVDQFVVSMVQQIKRETDSPDLPPSVLRGIHQLIERLRPIAIGSVSAAFPVVLQQEFDRDALDLIMQQLAQAFSDGTSPEGPTPGTDRSEPV
jgi:DNA-binding transcriptional MerR regulator